MPFAISGAGTLGQAGKTLLSHIAGADPDNSFAETCGRVVREAQVIVLEATARGAMASRMVTRKKEQGTKHQTGKITTITASGGETTYHVGDHSSR